MNLDGKPILNLHGRLVEVVPCPFDAEERAFYDALEQKTSLTFNKVSPEIYCSLRAYVHRLVSSCWYRDGELHLGVNDAAPFTTR